MLEDARVEARAEVGVVAKVDEIDDEGQHLYGDEVSDPDPAPARALGGIEHRNPRQKDERQAEQQRQPQVELETEVDRPQQVGEWRRASALPEDNREDATHERGDEELCADVNEVFKQLTGLGRASKMKHLWQSPFTLHKRIVAAIRNEAKLAAEGQEGRIIAKMNALLEPQIIEELYLASAAGVRIDLVVRGVCALKPGIAGLSENIRVRSVVGRFLEHSRVFYFRNGGAEDVFLASADWMDRNFFRRIELCFPVLDPALKRRVIREGLQPYLDDNCHAWEMRPDGSYEQLKPRRGRRRSAQEELLYTLATPS